MKDGHVHGHQHDGDNNSHKNKHGRLEERYHSRDIRLELIVSADEMTGSRKGWLCHNSLAFDPQQREVLGLTNQILYRRTKVRKNETQAAKRKRKNRESRLWLQGVETLPADWNIVDVCDRGADTFVDDDARNAAEAACIATGLRAFEVLRAMDASRGESALWRPSHGI